MRVYLLLMWSPPVRQLARWAATVVVVSGAVTCLTSCADEPVSGPLLSLELATPDEPTDINADHVRHFVAEVDRLSGGTIRIELTWNVDRPHGWDQMVAEEVASGTYDLGLVPARAWDELGVTSLRSLDTPFLVDSTALVEQVLNSDLREELMSGLPHAGVVGLDLFPERLRHPVGFKEPLLGLDDYRGAVIRAPRSQTTWRTLEAFGAAEVVDDDPSSAEQRGMETSYGVGGTGIATGNVVLFPKVESLVVDADVRDRLRDDEWEILQQAAANTRGWLFDNVPDEAAAAADFCQEGGRIATASTLQLEQLQRAAEPVVTWLREDEQTADIIDAISSAASAHPDPEVVEQCPAGSAGQGPGGTDEAQLRQLNGRYVAVVTQQQLRAAGVTDRAHVLENSGHYVWTLDDGHWSHRQRAVHYLSNPRNSGTFTYEDGKFTLYWGDGGFTRATLDVAQDGTIIFRDIEDSNPDLQAESEGMFGSPWTRVAELGK